MNSTAPAPANATALGFLRCSWTYLRTHKGVAAVVLMCCLAEVSFTTGLPMCFAYLVDKVLVGGRGDLLVPVLSAMGGAVILAAFIGFGRAWLVANVIVTMAAEIRARLFAHLQKLPLGFYQRTPQGDIMTRFSGNLKDVERTLEGCVPWILIPGLETLITVSLLFHLDWRLALLALLVFPASVMGPRFFSPRVASASQECKVAEGNSLTVVQENLGAQPVVKGFSLEPVAREHFAKRNLQQSTIGLRLAFAGAMLERTASVGTYVLQVAVLGGGVWLAYRKEITIGQLGAFQTLFMGLCFSVSYIIQFVPRLVDAGTSFQHVNALLAEPVKVADVPSAPALSRFTRALEFRDVSFSYTGEVLNLKNVSVTIPAGASVAFVGTSGSGKSTMLSLAMRFYEAGSGAVCYDGVDVKTAQLKSLRDQCGIVFQESFLFNESVRQNIRYGRIEATDDEVIAAARAAEIHDIILTLPQGYDTLVGERGGRLSGGQRQRVAIARALLRNPGILVLDEATSALDPGTEALLNKTLENAARGRTVLSVTHRLDAVVNYDLILVFDKGTLVEHGRHTDLVVRQGLYAKLVQKQQGLHVSADGTAGIDPTKLRELPLFQKLPDALLAEAAALFTTRTLEAGRELFREGDHADAFYVIVRGRVEAFKGIGATHKRIGVMEVGDALGEIALLLDSPRTATVRALTPATLLSLSREHFQNLFAVSRELRLALNEMVESRLKADRVSESAQSFVVPKAAAVVVAPAPSGHATPEQLSGVPILHQLPEELRRDAADLFTSEDLTAGQLVFREGQPADAFYVIVSGSVAVTKRFPDGQRELACLHASDAFGEIGLLSDSPRIATVRAVEPTTLLRLGREEFSQLLSRAPVLQQRLRALAAERVAANLASK